jgi:hypothetical protein
MFVWDGHFMGTTPVEPSKRHIRTRHSFRTSKAMTDLRISTEDPLVVNAVENPRKAGFIGV